MGFSLFVLHAERVAFVVDQKNFDLAVGAVVLVVGGAVGEDVLVADGLVDLGEDVGELALEDGGEAEAAGHPGKGLHLVLGLEVVEFAWTAAAAHLVQHGSGADGEDGDVWSALNFGEDLVEGELGEGVAARADEDDVLAAFYPAGAVEGFVEGVEHVGVGKARDDEGGERLGDELFVVGEVGEDVGAKVVGNDSDVVIGAQGAEEAVGGVPHVVDEVVAVGGELEQHDGGDGGLGGADAGDGLGDAVFEDEKIGGFEAGYELVGFVEDDAGVDVDDRDVNAEGEGLVVGIFYFGGDGSGRRWWLVGLLFFLEDDGAVVGVGAGVIGRGWSGFGLLGRGLGGGVLGVGGWQGKGNGAGEKEKDSSPDLRKDCHHLKLYSECWTAFYSNCERGAK